MGRGDGTGHVSAASATVTRRDASAVKHKDLEDLERQMNRIKARYFRVGRTKPIPASDQRKLIQIAQQCSEIEATGEELLSGKAHALGAAAREMFISSHEGFARNFVGSFLQSQASEDTNHAYEVLLQEARLGLNDAIDAYQLDFANPDTGERTSTEANPLTYAKFKMLNRLTDAAEHGEFIRVKGKKYDKFVQFRNLKNRYAEDNSPLTIEELAEQVGIKVDLARDFEVFSNPLVRLDRSDPNQRGPLGESIAAPQDRSVEDLISDADARERVRKAMSAVKSPVARKILAYQFGLIEDRAATRFSLSDGVFVDKDGNQYSAEAGVVKDRLDRDEKTDRKSQGWLNDEFEAGRLKFIAGTDESFELAKERGRERGGEMKAPTRRDELNRVITNKTGLPMSSGNAQHLFNVALQQMADQIELDNDDYTYRGPNVIEGSGSARKAIDSILANDAISSPQGPQSIAQIRKAAEVKKLVDKEGRLTPSALDKLLSA